jgi:hypothetical protein
MKNLKPLLKFELATLGIHLRIYCVFSFFIGSSLLAYFYNMPFIIAEAGIFFLFATLIFWYYGNEFKELSERIK